MKILKFASVGATLTLLSMAANSLLVAFLGAHVTITYAVIYCFFLAVSFFANSKITFFSKTNKENATKYFSIYISGLSLGNVLIEIYQYSFEAPDYLFISALFPLQRLGTIVGVIAF